MPRKLKTFTTSAGFFDLAVAAPSMKAALEAWGAGANLFHQGFARVTEDPATVRATTAKPGVVLRRPVGTSRPFREHADLPSDLPVSARRKAKPSLSAATVRHRERQQRAEQRERERRRAAIEAAESALDEARRAHDARRATIEAERAAIERRSEAEEARWNEERERLDTATRNARAGGPPLV